MTWLACVAACDGGGGSSDAGTGSGGPIVIAATTHVAAESVDTCGACHVVIDEVRDGEADVHIVPDLRVYLVHEQMMFARDLVEP
ncbi:MAG TPA: hypothetical protein VM261_16090 [Kofleriaceae bacterium]|nr:hypothetical protein [Kofleriaceae bacterium]